MIISRGGSGLKCSETVQNSVLIKHGKDYFNLLNVPRKSFLSIMLNKQTFIPLHACLKVCTILQMRSDGSLKLDSLKRVQSSFWTAEFSPDQTFNPA